MLILFLFLISTLPQNREKVWVYFTDKGIESQEEMMEALSLAKVRLSERAIRRRLMVRSYQNLVSYLDIPVCEEYVKKVEAIGARVYEVSRWLNAATFVLLEQNKAEIENLPFVEKIRPVRRFRERLMEPEKGIDYGDGRAQIEMLGLDKVHKKGYIGEGILIGMLDTGYKIDLHPALQDINVVYEYDFISNDSIARYDPEDPIDDMDEHQISHGTRMLSLIGARATGRLVGAAFGADFAIARTELIFRGPGDRRDIISEEGWWIAGVEFLEKVGADIISSSLGYRVWYDSLDYRYEDMDGETTPMSIVASKCLDSFNILLVNAMGNVRNTERPDTAIRAPADAHNILASGGVCNDREWYWRGHLDGGSAIGPPYDQVGVQERTRWKPDVAGPWYGYAADPWGGYSRIGGTSIATAMIAGAAASILSGHRKDGEGWSARKLRDAIVHTASQSGTPDDTLGYGIVNAYKALYYEDPIVFPLPYDRDRILSIYPSPFTPGENNLSIHYSLVNNSFILKLYIYTLSGRLIREIRKDNVTIGSGVIEWDGRDNKNNLVPSGVYISLLRTGVGRAIGKIAVVR